jgi:hypothetical protein
LTCKCNSFLHAGVEAVDQAHPGPQDLSGHGATPAVGSIGWLRIRRPGTGSMAAGRPTSSELFQSGTERTGRASPQCTTMARANTSARCKGWYEILIISILNFCVTNLVNSMLQKKRTGVDPHYFDVWEPAHQGNTDAVKRLVTISLYSYAIFVIFILNSIFCCHIGEEHGS